ncbi:hypothetical protein [Psychroserpens sp. SPM9]|uniref:hypothetical protein n=1 Tax=Psychroserpens sp. SPM9 TaxID=2975598 RepID=UPI0021A3D1A8|nr:hypothetical protein [Psychroserpens sp. SPM9]MDG5490046.1 hypothetical protein [Psychroserpens sp. SPM9]
MKNLYKILFFSLTLLIAYSCDNSEGENEGKFDDNPRTGWVQFVTSGQPGSISIDTYDTSNLLEVPVFINVPISESELLISYDLVAVSGPNPSTVFSNDGVLVNPANNSTHFFFSDLEGGVLDVANGGTKDPLTFNEFPRIQFDIAEAANISETMVFDIVMTATDRDGVTVGVQGSDRPTAYRIQICPTLDASTNNFVGDYNLTVTSGNSLFGGPVFADQVVTINEGDNGPFSRQFDVAYEPGGSDNTMTVTFGFSNGQVIIDSGLSTNIGCTTLLTLGGDSSSILPQPCDDSESLTLNMLDFEGGSGGCGVADVPLVVVLTKV